MTDRELMQMALEAVEYFYGGGQTQVNGLKLIEALRKRLSQPESEPVTWEFESLGHAMLGEGKPFYRSGKKISLSAMKPGNRFILVRTGQVYSIKDNGSVWNETENRPSRLHKNCQVEPIYTKPVHAIDISQERVDETAKRKHEPVAWLSKYTNDDNKTIGYTLWKKDVGEGCFPVYTAPPKREWVGLTDEEILEIPFLELVEGIQAKLKEKNG